MDQTRRASAPKNQSDRSPTRWWNHDKVEDEEVDDLDSRDDHGDDQDGDDH